MLILEYFHATHNARRHNSLEYSLVLCVWNRWFLRFACKEPLHSGIGQGRFILHAFLVRVDGRGLVGAMGSVNGIGSGPSSVGMVTGSEVVRVGSRGSVDGTASCLSSLDVVTGSEVVRVGSRGSVDGTGSCLSSLDVVTGSEVVRVGSRGSVDGTGSCLSSLDVVTGSEVVRVDSGVSVDGTGSCLSTLDVVTGSEVVRVGSRGVRGGGVGVRDPEPYLLRLQLPPAKCIFCSRHCQSLKLCVYSGG